MSRPTHIDLIHIVGDHGHGKDGGIGDCMLGGIETPAKLSVVS